MHMFGAKPSAKNQKDVSHHPNKDELNKSLFWAVFHGEVNKVKTLLIFGADPNVLVGDNFSIEKKHYPIHIAAYKGYTPFVSLLLSAAAKMDVKAQDGSTPLLMACQQGHINVVQLLLESNPTLVNDNDDAEETALIIAAGAGNKSLVELLICKGANINKLTKNGVSPLFFSVQHSHEDVARLLIDNKAEINHKRKSDGATALYMAVMTKQLNMALLLVCKGGDITSKNLDGLSVQELASKQNVQMQSALKGYKVFFIEEVLRLIQAELTLYNNSSPAYNWLSKLQLAIKPELNSDEFFKKLQTILKDVNDANYIAAGGQLKKLKSNIIEEMNRYNKFKTIELQPPNLIKLLNEPEITLPIAIQKGLYEKVKMLVNKENIDMLVDEDNNTPLLLALKLGFYIIAQFLVANGATVHKENKQGFNAMDICPESVFNHVFIEGINIKKDKIELTKQIENIKQYKEIKNSLWNPSFHVLKAGDGLKHALSSNCNLEEINNQGMTPLLQAALKKSTYNTLLVLIKAGSDLNAKDRTGKSLETLIEHNLRGKLPPSKIDKLYKTINKVKKAQCEKNTLIQAILSGYYNLVFNAIKNGEDINQLVGKDDETPLLIALRQENWVIAKLLIDNGAKLDVTTKSGLTIKILLAKMAISQDIIFALFDNIDDKNISLPQGNYSPTLFSHQNVSGQSKINSDVNPKNAMKSDDHSETSKIIATSSKTIGSGL